MALLLERVPAVHLQKTSSVRSFADAFPAEDITFLINNAFVTGWKHCQGQVSFRACLTMPKSAAPIRNHQAMNNNLFLTAVVMAALTSGCASITGSSNQSVSVQTHQQGGKELAGAACELTNNKGKWFVTSPGSVMIHRSNDDMQVVCTKNGVEPGRAAVVSETKGSMFGNIIFGGGIGAIVDHNNGAAYEYPALIQILMGAFSTIEPIKIPDQSMQGTTQSSITPTSAQLVSAVSVRDEKLKELKRLSDAGLISQDVYLERQRKLLE